MTLLAAINISTEGERETELHRLSVKTEEIPVKKERNTSSPKVVAIPEIEKHYKKQTEWQDGNYK